MLCNGALVSRTTYAALFAVIGTVYGEGDGSTTFALPDLRGRYIEGQNASPIGTYWDAGLPNVEGSITPGGGMKELSVTSYSGALRTFENGRVTNAQFGTSASWGIIFDASKYNSIYGASSTVQPPALTMRFYIKY